MKKFFALVAVATLSLGAVSCGEKAETTEVETTVDTTAAAVDSTAVVADSTVVEAPATDSTAVAPAADSTAVAQ